MGCKNTKKINSTARAFPKSCGQVARSSLMAQSRRCGGFRSLILPYFFLSFSFFPFFPFLSVGTEGGKSIA